MPLKTMTTYPHGIVLDFKLVYLNIANKRNGVGYILLSISENDEMFMEYSANCVQNNLRKIHVIHPGCTELFRVLISWLNIELLYMTLFRQLFPILCVRML